MPRKVDVHWIFFLIWLVLGERHLVEGIHFFLTHDKHVLGYYTVSKVYKTMGIILFSDSSHTARVTYGVALDPLQPLP